MTIHTSETGENGVKKTKNIQLCLICHINFGYDNFPCLIFVMQFDLWYDDQLHVSINL